MANYYSAGLPNRDNEKSRKNKASRKAQIITIIIAVIVILNVAVLTIYSKMSQTVPDNPVGTIGNTAGNLNNGGYFCESDDGYVYFCNTHDGHSLYRMRPDQSDQSLISKYPAAYINSAGKYIYFYYDDMGESKFMGISGRMNGIYRVNPLHGRDVKCLDRCVSGIVSLSDNNLYYQHYDNNEGMTLYTSDLNGKEKFQCLKEIVNPACIINSRIYYPDQENMFRLNVTSPLSQSSAPCLDERMYNPTPLGGWIYYMNVDDDYKLYRFETSSGTRQKITNDRVDTFNVYGDVIYYQKNSTTDPKLIRIHTDGSGSEVVAEGNYTGIECTSTFTYFRDFDSDNFYYTSTLGGIYVEQFNPSVLSNS